MRKRGFDFSLDIVVINLRGRNLFDLGTIRSRQGREEEARAFYDSAVEQFQKTLVIDPENVTAHFNLHRLYETIGEEDLAAKHQKLHLRYKPDDNATGRAVRLARERYPAADHAAEAVVIYQLDRTIDQETDDDQ